MTKSFLFASLKVASNFYFFKNFLFTPLLAMLLPVVS